MPTMESFMGCIATRDAHEPEFLQAVHEVVESLWPFLERNPEYREQGLLQRLVEADRIIQFRVTWIDDEGEVQSNRAWRVQHNAAIGPYKGGMRFHPSVNLSRLKFLAFEQTLKNALTTLPMGGGKGGSDFDPKGKSDGEVMRFCQSLMIELHRHVGADTDVPAGDIGVGEREIGFMNGMMKKLTNNTSAAFTGKGITYGGSQMRPEATGFGTVYFAQEMLARAGEIPAGARASISGSGNVAQYAAKKLIELGATVLTLSDSGGTMVVPEGLTMQGLEEVMEWKNEERGRLSRFCADNDIEFRAGDRPWGVPVDIALPCACENEISGDDAETLVANGVRCVAEGANMPSTAEAVSAFQDAGILYAPGKASNAGGVAVSGLEMSQNSGRISWQGGDVDRRLHDIMRDIHTTCVRYGGREDGSIDYVDGANIGGFVKVADAMLAQGII